MLDGAENLRFRCSGCGRCCHGLRVALTHHDARRLALATLEPVSHFVEFLSPDEVDMTLEPSSFAELASGRRLMVLAQRDGACRFLDSEARCGVYGSRPLDCRQFPFDAELDPQGVLRRLRLLPFEGCDSEQGAAVDAADVAAAERARNAELAEYQLELQRWNRLARHRRRLGHRVGDERAFLAFLGLR